MRIPLLSSVALLCAAAAVHAQAGPAQNYYAPNTGLYPVGYVNGHPANAYTPFQTLRAEFGGFLDEERSVSVEAAGFVLFPNHERFFRSSDATGTPAILRPAFNSVGGNEFALIDALPGIASGQTEVLN